ncbi:MAG: EAL domain-containing protein, partial [Pseudomonadota bacterium]
SRCRGIVNDSPTSRLVRAQFDFIAAIRSGIDVEWLSLDEYTFDEAAQIMALDRRPHVAYFFLAAFKDSAGETLSADALYERLAGASSRPAYGLIHRPDQRHLVGGHLLSKTEQARAAIRIATRVLNGERIDDIGPVLKSPNLSRVDAQVAGRYGLNLDALGPNVVIYNRIPTFLERNARALSVGAIVLLVMLALLGFVYAVQRRVRRGLETLNQALGQRNVQLLKAQARIEHQSLHDALTGLPNRRYVEQRFRSFAKEPPPPPEDGAVWALLHIDLDRFKQINDTLGHPAGDHVLKAAATILKKDLPSHGFAARIGGDEFVVFGLFEGRDGVSAYADRLVTDLRRPVPYENHLCRFGASIGAAIANSGEASLETLFRKADIALYRAKADGRGRFAFHSEEHQAQIVASKTLADDFVRGLEAGEIEPFFQPQVCARTGRVIGVEALARWIHPSKGVLSPAAFMATAANLGLTPEIDRIVMSQACKRLADWRREGVELQTISVNLSARRLTDPSLPDAVRHLEFGDTRLCFELVESIFLEREGDDMLWAVDRLREAGALIEIDDFGTGHASILGMLRLKPDGLKIARELVDPIERAPERLPLVRSIIEIGKTLGVYAVAEGVETEGQGVLLAEMGVEILQGYAISRPIPHNQVVEFIQRRTEMLSSQGEKVA